MVQFHDTIAHSYCDVVAVSTDSVSECAAFRAGLNARFTFLSDAERQAVERLGIVDDSDPRRPRIAAPFTFALLPDLTVHRIYNGWWFVGRPTPHELRLDIREMSRRCRENYEGPCAPA
ncbi:MAG: redoxin domain-containing protein [Candidatus Tectomicrobia bacterium]|nr:redoxin domain-containing protein [Candidatus Tectomicrobia bacterium]